MTATIAIPTPTGFQRKNPRFDGWETPPSFFKALDGMYAFNLDAMASHVNNLCDHYCTEDGFWSKYGKSHAGVDGLTFPWEGYRVFCNPPYTADLLLQVIAKAAKREAQVAALLLPPSVDTQWWRQLFEALGPLPYKHLDYPIGKTSWNGWTGNHGQLWIMEGRLRFWHPALRDGFTLQDYKRVGDTIFDYSLPHVPGEQPRCGNVLAVFS